MISIQNESLAKYVMFKLNKIENSFTQAELASITELVVNPVNIINKISPIDLEVLRHFTGLNKIELINLYIENKDIENLQKLISLKSITFENCFFEDVKNIKNLNLTQLHIINCSQNIDYIYSMIDLQNLAIVNNQINIENLNNLKNLKYLQISHSNIIENSSLEIISLQELYLDNTNILNLDFVKNLPNLQKLSISKNQYTANICLITELINNGIDVMLENMVNLKYMEDFDE